ncbi:MAG TPA: phosphoribosylaminoimidazolesuccinocarboxamide synthase [Lentisphaeria bacterium]|nr:phosphoribosylaminoimidazolesuccinocarboxamide synthase [Lentisphaeria bacterium]HCG48073.1 phosphoribosylaminoimidazolesuccinocarboxamide synthase [Lentisphaeria bacterium]
MKYDSNGALLATSIPGLPEPHRGKVRDIYDLGDSLLFVATDRISAFDCVMPNGIPDKGKVLTQMSLFWFELLSWMPNHLLCWDAAQFPASLKAVAGDLAGRSLIVKKARTIPLECIVRGYLIGSGWKDYRKNGRVCGIPLPTGYQQAQKLEEPLFTPSTKADSGHDENISFETAVELVGREKAEKVRECTLRIYKEAAAHAEKCGIILADTKFEFGDFNGEVILIDEVLTPDSSRFWPKSDYRVGCSPPSLDKQFVRDYLESLDWDKTPPAPALPEEIVMKTREKYVEALKALSGKTLA